MSHTPGPWKIGTPPPNGEQTIGNSQGLMVAVATTGFNVPTLANAHLIAAAPELLDALNGLVNATCFADPPKLFNDVLCHEARVPVEFVEIARAAIAKARGQG